MTARHWGVTETTATSNDFGVERLRPALDEDWAPVLDELDRAFAAIFHQLDAYNADYEALQLLEAHEDRFAPPELEELRALLGLYGLETEQRLLPACRSLDHIEARQQHWYELSQFDADRVRREVAERAVARYGLMIDELEAGAAADGVRAGH